jgi:hypothetical protein
MNFWEELIGFFLFALIFLSDMISINKALIYMRNEVNKTIQFGRQKC